MPQELQNGKKLQCNFIASIFLDRQAAPRRVSGSNDLRTPERKVSALHDVDVHHRLPTIFTSTGLVPANLSDLLLDSIVIATREAQAFVPPPVAPLVNLEDLVLLGVGVRGAQAQQKIADGGAAGDMHRVEGDSEVSGQVPGCGVAGPEDEHLAVLRWEEVVVAGLAPHAAGGVGHVDGGKSGVDDWLDGGGDLTSVGNALGGEGCGTGQECLLAHGAEAGAIIVGMSRRLVEEAGGVEAGQGTVLLWQRSILVWKPRRVATEGLLCGWGRWTGILTVARVPTSLSE